MKQINWGFIGCGEVTEKKSGPAFNEVSGSRVVAVMGRSPEKTRSYAQRHGIPKWFTDAQALVDDPEVNAVYIATPPSSHATYAIMAMHAGKPCYVEKPLAASYDDCARVNHVSQMTGVPCYVAYYRRYLPYFREVKNVVSLEKSEKPSMCRYDSLVRRDSSITISRKIVRGVSSQISLEVAISTTLHPISLICSRISLASSLMLRALAAIGEGFILQKIR